MNQLIRRQVNRRNITYPQSKTEWSRCLQHLLEVDAMIELIVIKMDKLNQMFGSLQQMVMIMVMVIVMTCSHLPFAFP